MTEALEVTTFRLAGSRTAEDFVAANDDINAYLKRQPGFRWRRITRHDDGTVIDIVAWDSIADAEAGANGIVTEMRHAAVHAMIDQGTVDWRLVPVLQHTA
jgi:heme-degrading monooxygenase HmoA